MKNFRKIETENMKGNPFKLVGNDWMLVTAGNETHWNTMTASWGGFGVLWHKNVCFSFVRPQRYTYEFMENSDFFTLSFFSEDYREALKLCGTKSGRDIDKAREAGLTATVTPEKSIAFEEASLVVECKKIYFQDIDPAFFLDKEIESNYPEQDYHRMYIGEVLGCFVK